MGRNLILLATLMIAFTGCVRRTMTIKSDPPGALVVMNDQEVGRTPVTREFTWYGSYDVQLRNEGYETLNTKAHIIAPPWLWPPFDLLAEICPIPIRDNHTRSYTLKPASTQAAEPDVLLARAAELRAKLQSSKNTRPPATHPSADAP